MCQKNASKFMNLDKQSSSFLELKQAKLHTNKFNVRKLNEKNVLYMTTTLLEKKKIEIRIEKNSQSIE